MINKTQDMLGHVDAIFLLGMMLKTIGSSLGLLEAGVPIYVDKPLAPPKKAEYLLKSYTLVRFSHVLRFAKRALGKDKKTLGSIKHVIGRTPNTWNKYIIHAIDPILENLEPQGSIIHFKRTNIKTTTKLDFCWETGVTCSLQSLGKKISPIELEFIGTQSSQKCVFLDSFQAFKKALETFINDSVLHKISHKTRIIKSIELIELGN